MAILETKKKYLKNSYLGDFSSDGADLLQRFCPASSTIFGRTRTLPTPLLGPQVFPLTPSAGTIVFSKIYLINMEHKKVILG
jgi:hypothetical protein